MGPHQMIERYGLFRWATGSCLLMLVTTRSASWLWLALGFALATLAMRWMLQTIMQAA